MPARITYPALVLLVLLGLPVFSAEPLLSLENAVIVTPPHAGIIVENAVDMLRDEIAARTYFELPITHTWPGEDVPVIAVGPRETWPSLSGIPPGMNSLTVPDNPEGYRVQVLEHSQPAVIVVTSSDARGVLFGVGRLLRELRMTREALRLPGALEIASAPVVPLRGHQMGYRPKSNTYDAWTLPMWEQYLRDLAVFGTNAIELMPPRTDDAEDSPHFNRPRLDTTARVAQLAHDYGMQFWLWYPALDTAYHDPTVLQRVTREWEEVFAAIPHLDAVFVPAGDPGDAPPDVLMALLEKQAAVLRNAHPNAQIWIGPQGYTPDRMEAFLSLLRQEPPWLTGIVFGPQTRLALPAFRDAVPARYPIRHYPDIAHTYACQYAVQDWDTAFKLTQDREVVNPRPRDYARIFAWSRPYTDGFITYSEGVNDDVNKILWNALGWDPDQDVFTILREYARYFIGPDFEYEFAQLLLALEENWRGPVQNNAGIESTLAQVRALEALAPPQTHLQWRFQQARYRAYYDAYIQERLVYERHLENLAMAALRDAPASGALQAVENAEAILDRAVREPVAQPLRDRVSDLAEGLYQSIRMQLSVPRYRALRVGRGANLDLIDRPLNNRRWLATRFEAVRAAENEDLRLQQIDAILGWTDPGPGGFYDDLGDPARQPHLWKAPDAGYDPENRIVPLLGYNSDHPDWRISWFSDAETRYEAPLKMKYTNLDPNAAYRVRAIYAGDKFQAQLRLLADETIEVHPFVAKPFPLKPLEFDIPRAAIEDGELTLTWYQTPGSGSNGRGCQVTEVWLIRERTIVERPDQQPLPPRP